MTKQYWNSPYDETEWHDEFGFAKGIPSANRQFAETMIALGVHLSGRDKDVLIRKDYSEEFAAILPEEMRCITKCTVTTSDPVRTIPGFERSLVFDFRLIVRLPELVLGPISIHQVLRGEALRIKRSIEREFAMMWGIEHYSLKTDKMFQEARISIYMRTLYNLNKVINEMKAEQRL